MEEFHKNEAKQIILEMRGFSTLCELFAASADRGMRELEEQEEQVKTTITKYKLTVSSRFYFDAAECLSG